ncbi:MAG: 3-deoxy-8-phosphooctulonate synthase [bacterium]
MGLFKVAGIDVGGDDLLFILGPCVIENEEVMLSTAQRLAEIREKSGAKIVFKSSFDKANRSSPDSYRGPGVEEGLKILEDIGERFEFPLLTDIHLPHQAKPAAEVVDILQIPAFLCRQTDMVEAAAKTGCAVNIKKGQYMSPWNVEGILDKARSCGNKRLFATERGTFFGYNNWVVDMRSLAIMRTFDCAVVYDATHSIQLPGGRGDSSGGEREFILPLARAAVAAGVDGIFMEVHPEPECAKCDGPNMLPLQYVEEAINQLQELHAVSGKYRFDPLFGVNKNG